MATFTLGVISFDIEFLRKILAQALRVVVDGAIISVLHLKDILSAARKNADSLLNNVQRLGRSTVDEVKVIGTDIAIATTKAWRSSLVLVKRVAKSISSTETRDLELASDPLHVKVDQSVGYKDLIEIIVQEIKTSIGSKYYQSLILDINKNIYTNLHVNKFHIGIGSSSLDRDQPARAMHNPIIFSLSEKQKLYLQDKYFKDDLSSQIINTTDIKFVDII